MGPATYPPFVPGAIIADRYRVLRSLGRGGMSVLVAAEHLALRREVALKVLAPELLTSGEAVERFVREARAAARLESPHIARVLDVGTLPSGAPFMALELLDGVDLEQLVEEGRPPVADAIDLIVQACEGLAVAHAAGIVHRDIKPSNLFLTRAPDGSPLVKVLDFGVAKITEAVTERVDLTVAQATVGSPAYMSPEQLRDARDVDARADVWALGVVLYELLSGKLPFFASSTHGLAIAIAIDPFAPIEREGVSVELGAVIATCLAKSRDDRYGDVAALAAALAPFGGPGARARARRIANIGQKQAPLPRSAKMPVARPARTLRLGLVRNALKSNDDLARGLEQTLGERCDIVESRSYRALVELLRDQEIELAWLPPLAFLRARAARAAQLVVTLERGGAPSFGCAILGRAAVGEHLAAFRGGKVAWTDPWSASGYVVPRAMMREAGLDPDTSFSVELFLGSSRAVIDALRTGSADIGSSHCVLTPAGALASGPWSDTDGLRVLGVGGPVPCDAICSGPSVDAARRGELRAALSRPSDGLLAAFEATGMRDPDARLYELFRLAFLG